MDDTPENRYRLISERLNKTQMLAKYEGDYIRNISIDGYVSAYNSSLYTNIVRQVFTPNLLLKLYRLKVNNKEINYLTCEDCGEHFDKNRGYQRCHTLSRGEILKEALINLNCGKSECNIPTIEVIKEFSLLHAKYPLKIKCVECHKEETRINVEE
jgi:hypothetical protein